jgi:hypothetical protein
MSQPPLSTPIDALRPEPIHWFWQNRIPFGKLTILEGDPNEGKTLLALDLAARLSRGAAFPGGLELPQPGATLLLTCEDGSADTLLPRLHAAGADCSRIHLMGNPGTPASRPLVFPDDCPLLHDAIRATSARLVLIDPLVAFLSPRLPSGIDQMVRQALLPLAGLAASTGVAMLLIRHLSKTANRGRALYRGAGSIGLIAAARTAFLVGRDPADLGRHIFACVKNNLAEMPPSLAFAIRSDAQHRPCIDWLGLSPLSADDLVQPQPHRPPEALRTALALLEETLHQAPASHQLLLRKAQSNDVSPGTLRRAKERLGVQSEMVTHDGQRQWIWRLPDDPRPFDPALDHTRLIDDIWPREPTETQNPDTKVQQSQADLSFRAI